ncbi:MAG: feruloyl-CoA synthase [Oceanospirillales bacterium]|nr:feruloyl-CoA synthase [Oceanospirillales bacterium]MBR9888183.1 feruloyl-CoA synthase [Oceanospirillales bacterium]
MSAETLPVNVVTYDISVDKRDDGSMLVRSTAELPAYATRMTDKLEYWAAETPDKVLVAQRTEDKHHWETVTYAEALVKVKHLSQYLLNQNLSTERPLVILSGNSISHLLVSLAAMYVGIPFSPISTAYSLISTDFGKLRYITEKLTPGLVFVENLGPFRDAIDAVMPSDCSVLACEADHGIDNFGFQLNLLRDAVSTPVTGDVAQANAAVNGDTIAKLLFTSGSTGMPKGVINTQRMLCANQEMIATYLEFVREQPPVLCDWLPWNHTFGGNKNTGLVIYNGGSLYIDGGKPVARGIAETVANLREIAPTIYFNVPKGYELLAKELRQNPDMAKVFFSNLQVLFYAGAGLAQHVWDELLELSVQYTGRKVPILTGLGATETAPSALFTSIEEAASGVVGVPIPGVELKLIPNQGKFEVRIKGVSVMPGYWRDEEQTAKAYDEEGYYCLGDALRFIDEEKPSRGFLFDGRVSEDFKLDTGTWVSVGTLKAHMIHEFAPYIQDVVIVGRDRGFISALVFPDVEHCRHLIDLEEGSLSLGQIVNHEAVRQVFSDHLASMAEKSTGSSTRIKSLVLQSQPADIDAHEMTDKGSLNSNAVISHRADIVDDIYSAHPSAQVITL